MDVFALLPSTCGCIDTVAEIMLKRVGRGYYRVKIKRTSLSLSAETSVHLNSA